jgi:hypothetical protein
MTRGPISGAPSTTPPPLEFGTATDADRTSVGFGSVWRTASEAARTTLPIATASDGAPAPARQIEDRSTSSLFDAVSSRVPVRDPDTIWSMNSAHKVHASIRMSSERLIAPSESTRGVVTRTISSCRRGSGGGLGGGRSRGPGRLVDSHVLSVCHVANRAVEPDARMRAGRQGRISFETNTPLESCPFVSCWSRRVHSELLLYR